MPNSSHAVVIGAGFAGLACATTLAQAGWRVTVLEKNDGPGGRARVFQTQGFTFDMGPSWYWMPDVFEKYFARFGKQVSDYYDLVRLDPSYQVIFRGPEAVDIPAGMAELRALFEKMEPGSAARLDEFLAQAAYKYRVGMSKFVYLPGRSLREFVDWEVVSGALRLDLLQNMHHHVAKYFANPKLQELVEFPTLFLGATPQNTPALYSLMTYADLVLGTWYPMGGMHKIVEGMVKLATELGVEIRYQQEVQEIRVANGRSTGVSTASGFVPADAVVAGADYHHIEQQVLAPELRHYSPEYWDKRVMAPSSLLFYLGINRKLANLRHHNLFFDEDFNQHAHEIYEQPQWPSRPLFYASVPSQTDPRRGSGRARKPVFAHPRGAQPNRHRGHPRNVLQPPARPPRTPLRPPHPRTRRVQTQLRPPRLYQRLPQLQRQCLRPGQHPDADCRIEADLEKRKGQQPVFYRAAHRAGARRTAVPYFGASGGGRGA